ncbi:MAG: branched-chain amino acid ABC transporter permease [Casimicrobiaceae bacterium]
MSASVIVENILQALYTGVVVGCIYGLMCVGLSLIFGVMRVINFAQGEFLMLGMYAALFVFAQVGVGALFGPGFGAVVASLLGGVIVFAIGAVLYDLLLRPVTGLSVAGTEGEGHYPQLTLTLGLSLVLANGGLILFGSSPQTIRTPLSATAWELPVTSDISLFLNKARTVACIVTLVVAFAVAMFINRSRHGKILRAAADNAEAATYMGIRVTRAHRLAFALGAGISAIAGGLVATYYPFQPYVGLEFIIVMYAGVVLGGMGSVMGAFWGGLTIGLVQQLSTLVLPQQLQNATIFVVFLLIILLRPQGLFGRNVERV